MKRSWFFAVLGVLALAMLAPAGLAKSHLPTPSPSPTPIEDPQVTKVARQQFVEWQAGEVDKKLYAAQVLEKLTDDKIAQISAALAQLGPLTDTVYIGPWIDASFPPGARGYIYQMKCSTGMVYLWLAFDAQGRIATIFFKNRLDAETVTPSPKAS